MTTDHFDPDRPVDVLLSDDASTTGGRDDRPFPAEHSVTLDTVRQIADASRTVVQRVRQAALEVDELDPRRRTGRGYKITEVAEMVGKTTEAIRKAEREGRLERPPVSDSNRRLPYPLALVNAMRRHWNVVPGRRDGDEAIRIAIQNFKGGVAKTALSVHAAQYFARRGYRVLVIDCDSQASATAMFGFNPDEDIDSAQTLLPLFTRDESTLHYAIRPTHWDQLDIVAANLDLCDVEFSSISAKDKGWMARLDQGIESVQDAYDLVIVDPPPSLGIISLNVLRAVDGLIVPTPPSMVDFHSTASFFAMLRDVVEKVGEDLGEPVELEFLKVVLSKHQPGRASHELVSGFMAHSFGAHMLHNPLLASSEIENAAAQWQSVYDLETHTSSRETYRRCVESLDAVFGEIERLVQAVWDTRRADRVLNGGERGRAHLGEDGATATIARAAATDP